MSINLQKPVAKVKDAINKGDEDVYAFLNRELPANAKKRTLYFANALREAGERYDRYIARRSEWFEYANRIHKLKRITMHMEDAASGLRDLDILSRDDLTAKVGSKEIDELIGSLHRLSRGTKDLAAEGQTNGRPRDLAEERWILELADIYENAFHERASVWGTKQGRGRGRSFYSFLELSRPKSFPRHGKLHPRQVDRLLRRRCASDASAVLARLRKEI